jgi:hypothetical protein
MIEDLRLVSASPHLQPFQPSPRDARVLGASSRLSGVPMSSISRNALGIDRLVSTLTTSQILLLHRFPDAIIAAW